jgi:hypothetical protein
MTEAGTAFSASRSFRIIVLGAALALAVTLWTALCLMPLVQWNPARLAPSFALVRGLPIYALRDSGAQLGWFYGPGFPLWYAPVALLDNPTCALLAAGLLNILTWLGPVVLLLRAAGASPWATTAGTVMTGVLMLGNNVTNYGFYFVHVDALCLALQITACLGLHAAVARGGRSGLHVAAIALSAAFWTKVLSLALLPALLCWLWHSRRRDLVRPFLFLFTLYAGLFSAAVLAAFGPEEIIFNVFLVHARNPWRGDWRLLAGELGRLASACWSWLPALLLAWWLHRRKEPEARASDSPPPSWAALFVWAALWTAPLGLSAVLKAGGGLNSLHSVHFLLLAGLVHLAKSLDRPARAPGMAAGLFLLTMAVPLGHAAWIAALPGKVHWTMDRHQEDLLRVARENPGRCYFPWSPMITIIAEHRISPLDDALYCLWLCKLEPPVEKIRAAVPPNPIIIYSEPAQSRFAMRYFNQRTGSGPP